MLAINQLNRCAAIFVICLLSWQCSEPDEKLTDLFPYCSGPDITDGVALNAEAIRQFSRTKRDNDIQKEFVAADESVIAKLTALFESLKASQYSTTKQVAGELNYQVCLFKYQQAEDVTETYLFFSEENRQQIHIHWRTGATDPVIIESPHSYTDNTDPEVATIAFVKSKANALIINALDAHQSTEDSPCTGSYFISDGAHYDKGWFHAAHQALASVFPQHGFFQFHGMTSVKDNGDVRYLDISPGFEDYVKEDSLLAYFDNAVYENFGAEFTDTYIGSAAKKNSYTTINNGSHHPATFNVQGRHLNGSPNPCKNSARAEHYNNSPQRFVHAELTSKTRKSKYPELLKSIQMASESWRQKVALAVDESAILK